MWFLNNAHKMFRKIPVTQENYPIKICSNASIGRSILSWNSPGLLVMGAPNWEEERYSMKLKKPLLSSVFSLFKWPWANWSHWVSVSLRKVYCQQNLLLLVVSAGWTTAASLTQGCNKRVTLVSGWWPGCFSLFSVSLCVKVVVLQRGRDPGTDLKRIV